MIHSSTFEFLTNLAENNYREWFHAHRTEYEAAKQNVLDVATQLLAEINTFDKIGVFDVRKCMFRIARDTRFSHDKSPYKTNFGVILTPDGTTRSELAGYYMHIEPGNSFLSCGLYMSMPDVLKAVRTAIDEDYEVFQKIISKKEFKQTFGDLSRDDDALSRVPQGFDKDSPAADYLKLKHVYVMVSLKNKEAMASTFLQKALGYCRLMKPLGDFLNEAVKNR